MRLLVTGSSGFIGLALTTHCVAMGDDVTGLDLRPPDLAAAELRAGPGAFRHFEGDCGDRALLERLLAETDAGGPPRGARRGRPPRRDNLRCGARGASGRGGPSGQSHRRADAPRSVAR